MTCYTFWIRCLCPALLCSALLFTQALSTQELNNPKITNIPGGFFVEWTSPVDVAAVQLDSRLTGSFEVMFDIPSVGFIAEVIDRRTPPVSSPELVTALADYWIVRGKPERAIPLYEESLQQGGLEERRIVVFKNNLAMLYSRVQGEHNKALELVDLALETRRDNFTLLDTKGLILLNAGDPAAAIPVLQRAVELSCQLPIYCMHLAYALYRDGRPSQARRYFDSARDQLIPTVPNMSKENKAMFDTLQSALPPLIE